MAKKEIKNIFSYDEAAAPAEWKIDGEEFVVRRADRLLVTRHDELKGEVASAERASHLPLALRILEIVFLLFGLGSLSGALDAITDGEIPLSEMAANGIWYYVGFGAGALVVAALLCLLGHMRKRRVLSSPALADLNARCSRLEREMKESLQVPDTAFEADIFVPVRVRLFGIRTTRNVNQSVSVFSDRDALCIATVEGIVRIPLARIGEVVCVKRQIAFPYWNKEIPFNAGLYKPYKIRLSNGSFLVKSYYRVTVRGSEEYELLIPPYEFDRFAPLLGASVSALATVKK